MISSVFSYYGFTWAYCLMLIIYGASPLRPLPGCRNLTWYLGAESTIHRQMRSQNICKISLQSVGICYLVISVYLCSLGECAILDLFSAKNVIIPWFRLKILLVLCKSLMGDQRRVTSLSSFFKWMGLAFIQVLWCHLLNSCISLLLSKTKANT